jgi:hypothetical protein
MNIKIEQGWTKYRPLGTPALIILSVDITLFTRTLIFRSRYEYVPINFMKFTLCNSYKRSLIQTRPKTFSISSSVKTVIREVIHFEYRVYYVGEL